MEKKKEENRISKNEIYSIGVDIGTSTTEIIISRLKMKNILSGSLIKLDIVGRLIKFDYKGKVISQDT